MSNEAERSIRKEHAVVHRPAGVGGAPMSWCDKDDVPQPCDTQVILGILDAALASAESGDEGLPPSSALRAWVERAAELQRLVDVLERQLHEYQTAAAQPEPEPGLSDYQRGYVDGFDAPANVEARTLAAPPQPAVERECPTCHGDGFVLGSTMVCCGNILDSGECCAALYGDANLVPEEAQEPCTDPFHESAALATQPSPERLREALLNIEGWSRFHKEEPGTQIRRSLRLIHEEAQRVLATSGDQGEER